MVPRLNRRAPLAAAALALSFAMHAPSSSAADPVMLSQGPNWTDATRSQFYVQDQGSQIMPLSWYEALRQPNGQPFSEGSLSRYGYLPYLNNPTAGLPVGFTVGPAAQGTMLGMTCAACHTRQIDVAGKAYRIDGGPAIVDFQSFLQDLDTAAAGVETNDSTFQAFAVRVLGPSPSQYQREQLRAAFDLWFLRYDTLMRRALPSHPWGTARLDAVGMIFNRNTGLDLGPAPGYLIPANIQVANAPVRYPFLWNAAVQDRTQWPGFAPNGSPLLSLGRNLGEVFGVFASFKPVQYPEFGVTDFLAGNSANFTGLIALGKLMRDIGPPKYPFAINQVLAAKGQAIFNRPTAEGGCVSCHGIRPGTVQFYDNKTWATPVQNVGTDGLEVAHLGRMSRSGSLTGATKLFSAPSTALKPVDLAVNILDTSVLGSVEEYCLLNPLQCALGLATPGLDATQINANDLLAQLQTYPQRQYLAVDPSSAAYESRVLQGIWAAAPYLHNGSVQSLAQLLTPSADRVRRFAVGPEYDPVAVGLASTQPSSKDVFTATGCDNLQSGNSNCGHDFGTTLPAADKAALLEYLKTL